MMSSKIKVMAQVNPEAARDEAFTYLNKQSFDSLPDASCTEVELHDILEFFGAMEIVNAYKKLRHRGILRVVGVDALECIHKFHHGQKTLEELSDSICNGRQYLNSVAILKATLEQNSDAEIRLCTINSEKYILEVFRP